MRLPLLLILPVLLLGVLADWYICRALRLRCSHGRRFWYPFSVISAVLFQVALVVLIAIPKKGGSDAALVELMWILYAYFSVYLPKYLFVLIDLLGKIPCLVGARRLRGFSYAGIVVSVAAFFLMWWGAIVNRFNIDIEEVEFSHPLVPQDFDGYRIVQLSDLHVGSYGTDTAFISKLVERVNALDPDLILFTGDLVNRKTTELEPFAVVLSRLKAPDGVFSVLGNHDYGDYYNWPSPGAKAENMNQLLAHQRDMGWQLLRNRTQVLHRGSDSINIIGVDNIGDPPFPRYGDLDAAYPTLSDSTFKILMSHNPSHWTDDLRDSGTLIPLTLAGHTHAMQISLGRKWSPGIFKYRTWGGMYSDSTDQSLYVNIGIGEVGIPARIGATPEVTLITLRSDD